MKVLAVSPDLVSTIEWISCLSADMPEEHATRLYRRIYDLEDDLSSLALPVLLNEICLNAFGIDSTAASRLAATYVTKWFPFRSWLIRQGLVAETLPIHDILTAIYGWIMDGCADEDEAAEKNRRIFRESEPWG